jgi:hypothetical protein
MSKYSTSTTQMESSIKKTKEPNPIWRGIGCLMMIVIPAVSILAGNATVKYLVKNQMRYIPNQLLGYPQLPDIIYKSNGLEAIFGPLAKIYNLNAIVVVSLLYMVLISALISVIYATVYAFVGPSRYGPTDAPPEKIRVTKKSR